MDPSSCTYQPNVRDVLKLIVGSKSYESYSKHLLDMTQIELYIKKIYDGVLQPFNISISQRLFEKCKTWYVRIKNQRILYCSKVHMQFRYYYDIILYIHGTLHDTSNLM